MNKFDVIVRKRRFGYLAKFENCFFILLFVSHTFVYVLKKLGIDFIDADYDVQNWFKRAKGLELEPERGKRCTMCFDMRFERTALFAYENGFEIITSSLGISRWKDMDQINQCGIKSASKYPGISYWTYNGRKNGGSSRRYEIAKDESFYKQEFCGCVYSLRDTNMWRALNGKSEIEIGKKYY